jgi:hypothetical protein
LLSAGTAALTIGFALGLNGMPPRVSASETIVPKSFAPKSFGSSSFASNNFTPDFDAYFGPSADREASAQSQSGDHQKWRLASLETTPVLLPPRVETWIAASTRSRASSAEPPAIDLRVASFDERFTGSADDWPGSLQAAQSQEPMGSLLPPAPGSSERGSARRGPAARGPVPLPVSSPLGAAKKQTRVAEAVEDSSTPPSDAADEHTAIYDISAHKVYLPNGQRLEAHSGLGSHMDDPRYVSEKGRGPTPPNLYELSLREESFHGVRALRLTPVGAGNMFGRDGMLAHTYMLGSNGQSNGCVSFNDYQAFLNAYLSGDITHIVVVDHLATPPSSKTALGWIPEKIRALFGRS